jgi:hypothetical protein
METFDSSELAYFGNGLDGCGLSLSEGLLWVTEDNHDIIDKEISNKAKEVIVILTVSNNGKTKEIRFLCDGKETKSTDVSKFLKGDFVFPAICLGSKNQQITTIPIDQIKTRTPEIENLIKEYQQQHQNQSGGAVASPSSSATIQLQKELDEALQKIAALSAQLQQKDDQLKKKDDEIAALKQQQSS